MDRPTLFDQAGGMPALEALTQRFYERVFDDPVLTPLFRDPGEPHAERLALWLAELLGGPPLHTEQRGGFAVMKGAHAHLRISEEQRRHWADHMFAAAEEVGLPEDFRRALMPHIEGGSTFARRVSFPPDERWAR
jgi:truncated hemoglobin YjbI